VPEALTVASIEPAAGSSAGGTKVSIKGTGFVNGASVTIGYAATSVTVVNAKEITASTAAHGVGPQEVIVKETGLTSTHGPSFSYVAPPSVASVSPSSGSESGGTAVTITGENLANATAVRFGATRAASFTVISPTSIDAISPPGSGKVDVTVLTAGGASSTGAADAFSYSKPLPPALPAPAACTMTPIFLTVERTHKRKARPKITAGELRVTVRCTDNASVKLAGTVSVPVRKKAKHGKQRMRTYGLGPSTTNVAKDAGTVVAVKLPLDTLVVLVAKGRESVKVTLSAMSAGGPSYNGVSIKQLRL
jgi:IPT/TIG domain